MYFDPSEDYMGYMFAGDYCVTAMHVHCNVSFKFLVICRFVYVLIITVIHYGIITLNIFGGWPFFWQKEQSLQNVAGCKIGMERQVIRVSLHTSNYLLEFWHKLDSFILGSCCRIRFQYLGCYRFSFNVSSNWNAKGDCDCFNLHLVFVKIIATIYPDLNEFETPLLILATEIDCNSVCEIQ